MANVFFRVEGMNELQKSLRRLGQVPQKHVTASAKKGMNIPLKQARKEAPVDNGYLKQGMKLKGERSRKKGKKVYQIVFDASMNDVFQKRDKSGKVSGYYPVSMEYGFFDKKGVYHQGSANTGWVVGFVHSAFTENARQIENTIVKEMKKKIDAEIVKAGLR